MPTGTFCHFLSEFSTAVPAEWRRSRLRQLMVVVYDTPRDIVVFPQPWKICFDDACHGAGNDETDSTDRNFNFPRVYQQKPLIQRVGVLHAPG